ncbi:MAG: hypothetical protein M1828_002137 [Chrysothrix sp. TS-e1954]|nr:MAG: hypothetical protein M1828_002137 [Chrysothrix sp. TS-e1954]
MGTSPMSKRYDSLEAFQKETLGRLKPILKAPGLILKVHNVVGGDDEWATAELKADAECVNGQSYKMSYAWVIRFEPDSQMIVQVRAYLDTNLLTRTLQDHEAPVYSAPREF